MVEHTGEGPTYCSRQHPSASVYIRGRPMFLRTRDSNNSILVIYYGKFGGSRPGIPTQLAPLFGVNKEREQEFKTRCFIWGHLRRYPLVVLREAVVFQIAPLLPVEIFARRHGNLSLPLRGNRDRALYNSKVRWGARSTPAKKLK